MDDLTKEEKAKTPREISTGILRGGSDDRTRRRKRISPGAVLCCHRFGITRATPAKLGSIALCVPARTITAPVVADASHTRL